MFRKSFMIGVILMLCAFCNSSGRDIKYEYGYMSYDALERVYLPDNIKLFIPKKGMVSQFDCMSAKGEYQWVSDGLLLKGMWCSTSGMKTDFKYNQYLLISNMQYDNVVVFIPDEKITGNVIRDNDAKYIVFDLDIIE